MSRHFASSGSEIRTTAQTFHWVTSELESVIASVCVSLCVCVCVCGVRGSGCKSSTLEWWIRARKPTLACLKKSEKRFCKHCITSIWRHIQVCTHTHTHTHTHHHTVARFLSHLYKRRWSLWLHVMHTLRLISFGRAPKELPCYFFRLFSFFIFKTTFHDLDSQVLNLCS